MEFAAKVARNDGYADGWEDALWNNPRQSFSSVTPRYADSGQRAAYWDGYQLGFECARVRRLELGRRPQRRELDERNGRE